MLISFIYFAPQVWIGYWLRVLNQSKPCLGPLLCGPSPLASGWEFSGSDGWAVFMVLVAPGSGHDPVADHWLAMGWCRTAWLTRGVGWLGWAWDCKGPD